MLKKIALVAVVTLSLAACKTIPVTDYNQQVNASNMTKESVEKAILSGCQQRQWACKVESDGVIAGLLNWRGKQIKVGIHYDAKTYTIKYRDSLNLKYDGDSIHKKYGKWVNNLIRTIDSQLFTM